MYSTGLRASSLDLMLMLKRIKLLTKVFSECQTGDKVEQFIGIDPDPVGNVFP
jgi:hypothetical protein